MFTILSFLIIAWIGLEILSTVLRYLYLKPPHIRAKAPVISMIKRIRKK